MVNKREYMPNICLSLIKKLVVLKHFMVKSCKIFDNLSIEYNIKRMQRMKANMLIKCSVEILKKLVR